MSLFSVYLGVVVVLHSPPKVYNSESHHFRSHIHLHTLYVCDKGGPIMAPFSYRRGLRKTPKIALYLNKSNKKNTEKPPHKRNRKWTARWIILVVTLAMAIQAIVLRSVAIDNKVHTEEEQRQLKLDFASSNKNNNARGTIIAKPEGVDATKSPPSQQLSEPSTTKTSLLYEDPPSLTEFPLWIQEYVTWHQQIRKQFPGMELLNNPDAPNLLVRTCLGLCGGLHDRIGQLPWDLYLAYKTKRILLMAWQRPQSLENYLVPSGLLNWTVPEEAHFGFDDMRHVRNFTELFQGYPEVHPTKDFFAQDVDAALQRATDGGAFSKIRILRHRVLGHLGQGNLEERLLHVEAETNDNKRHQSIHEAPLFGKIFWLFFRPSPTIHEKTMSIMTELKLRPYEYTAVHCRVRHPKAFSYGANVKGKNPEYPADKTGLPWEGETRQAALHVAYEALHCASSAATTPDTTSSSVYFLSDSNDLVRHVTEELPTQHSFDSNWTNWRLQELVPTMHVVSRDSSEETAHIDRNKGRPIHAYDATFVDLLIVVHAKCVVYGIGYYAAFGAKISGTKCRYIYQQEKWGATTDTVTGKGKEAEICPTIQP
eukprot:scaffold4180_cov99-Cylindrotheca_fusiformis.AAC.4